MTEAPAGREGVDAIMVGVDGSDSSVAAARWAAAQAARTGDRVVLVSAWQYPTTWGSTIPLPDGYDPEADTRAVADPVATALQAEFPTVDVTNHLVEGHPAEVLVDASRHAVLLAVGSRGHGAFAGMLLGSVSEHCVTHAHCPVLVYRPRSYDS